MRKREKHVSRDQLQLDVHLMYKHDLTSMQHIHTDKTPGDWHQNS